MSLVAPPTTPASVIGLKRAGTKITVGTAYDRLTGRLCDVGGMDGLVVGDSIVMSVLGRESMLGATVDDLIPFVRAAGTGARRALIIADLPFGSFERSDLQAVRSATRLVKEGGAGAVKLEGGGTSISRARAITDAGIAVMAHLVPQGPLWVSGRWAQEPGELASQTLHDAQAFEQAGCFSVFLECVPETVATSISQLLAVPTIGYGSGAGCDGQCLDIHDVIGVDDGEMSEFSKRYADLFGAGRAACEAFVSDVRAGTFPAPGQAQPMDPNDQSIFQDALARELGQRSRVEEGR